MMVRLLAVRPLPLLHAAGTLPAGSPMLSRRPTAGASTKTRPKRASRAPTRRAAIAAAGRASRAARLWLRPRADVLRWSRIDGEALIEARARKAWALSF